MHTPFGKTVLLLPLLLWGLADGSAQQLHLYKKTDTTRLFLEVYAPKDLEPGTARPAMVFFFGGGWRGGDRSHFLPHARYFSKRGIVCFLADYRIQGKHGTSPFESLKDAKSALRYVRKHAADFGVDPKKIIAAGGSAGGHLAAATALIKGYNDQNDDLAVSCIPNALVLFNPVIDNGPGGYGHERVGEAYTRFSPLHNIRKGAPPTLFLLGTKDKLIPVETARYYKTVMEKVGSPCELRLYEGQGHGFFNYRNLAHYRKTLRAADDFLTALGYLAEGPQVPME